MKALERIKAMKFIGVDGCKIGWFCTAINHKNDWEIGVSENIEKLWKTHKDAKGLPMEIVFSR
jgi:predicted RNase H-like nuclease